MSNPSPAPELSICMVAYQAVRYLKDCLESIYRNPPRRSFEVIVVDNGSSDGTAEMLREEFPQVRLIVNPGNEGYTHPMNQALKAASGGYRIQLNRLFYVQPDVQYIIQPGGTGSIPNALVLGMQIGVTF